MDLTTREREKRYSNERRVEKKAKRKNERTEKNSSLPLQTPTERRGGGEEGGVGESSRRFAILPCPSLRFVLLSRFLPLFCFVPFFFSFFRFAFSYRLRFLCLLSVLFSLFVSTLATLLSFFLSLFYFRLRFLCRFSCSRLDCSSFLRFVSDRPLMSSRILR